MVDVDIQNQRDCYADEILRLRVSREDMAEEHGIEVRRLEAEVARLKVVVREAHAIGSRKFAHGSGCLCEDCI